MRRLDVDAMLAELPAGIVDRWWEYYKLEPWGDDWERSSMIATNVINAMMSAVPRQGGDAPELIASDAFVPYRQADEHSDEVHRGADALESLRI